MKRIFFFAIPLLAVFSCSRPRVVDETYRWPSSGVAEADSLLAEFEHARTDISIDIDTRSQIMARFCSVAALHPDNEMLAMRKLYIETCAQYPTDPHGATKHLADGMQRFDSLSSPYDWHSLQSLSLMSDKNIYRKYMLASSNVEFFEKAGAEMDMAANLMIKGNALCELSDTVGALECFSRALDIFSKYGAQEALYATKLNTLPLLKRDEQIQLLDRLLEDTVVSKIPKVYVPVLQTAYYITDSEEYLDQAIAMASAYTPTRNLLPVLLSMKAADMSRRGAVDDALRLSDTIRAGEEAFEPSTRYRIAIHANLAEIYNAAGMKDSCIGQLVELNLWTDSMQREANYRGIYGNEARLHIEDVQNYARFKHRTVIIWWVVSLLAVILIAVIIFRNKAAKRREQISNLDERIDHQRRLNMAQESMLDNNNKIVGQIETIAAGLADKSLSTPEALAKLRRVISEFHRTGESQKGFLTVSREIGTSFSKRLKTDFPDISESQLRLASMIAAGMDSHQLTSTLNISSKSLYTSRYRLRTRFNLPKDASLEDFLRQYAN